MKTRLAVCVIFLALLCMSSSANDKKKHFIVRAGTGAQQVNNHPWAYTTPGQASTNCSTNGTVNATGTTVGNTTDVYGTTNANTNCNTTYRPAQTTTGNRVTVDNASWVTDINSGVFSNFGLIGRALLDHPWPAAPRPLSLAWRWHPASADGWTCSGPELSLRQPPCSRTYPHSCVHQSCQRGGN